MLLCAPQDYVSCKIILKVAGKRVRARAAVLLDADKHKEAKYNLLAAADVHLAQASWGEELARRRAAAVQRRAAMASVRHAKRLRPAAAAALPEPQVQPEAEVPAPSGNVPLPEGC